MADEGRGAIKANQVHGKGSLWGVVEGNVFVFVDEVIGNVGGVKVSDIGGGTAGVIITMRERVSHQGRGRPVPMVVFDKSGSGRASSYLTLVG